MREYENHILFFFQKINEANKNKKAAEERGDTLAVQNIEKKIKHYEAACDALEATHLYTQIGII